MRVLVTGSSGQVGSYVAEEARARGWTVTGVDLRPGEHTALVQDVRELPARMDVDAIVHCAAQIDVASSVRDPRHDAAHNVDGTLAVLETARASDVDRVVCISSAAVYGDASPPPVGEDARLAPRSPYGLSKVVGERYCGLYRELYGVPAVVLRPFNIFSPRQDPSNGYSGVISKFARALACDEPVRIFGDGNQSRDFVHASDVVEAIRIGLTHPDAVGGTFNVGTGRAVSIHELAERMCRLAGRPFRPTYGKARDGDVRHSRADVSRLRGLGFEPRTDLDVHLAAMI